MRMWIFVFSSVSLWYAEKKHGGRKKCFGGGVRILPLFPLLFDIVRSITGAH
jgi:hypothetical protein